LFALPLAGALCAALPAWAATAPQPAKPAAEKLIEHGIATWYGAAHSKHFTASGERFEPWKLTAAHRSIPLGSLVRVTDMSTGRSVVVKINDREPPHGHRCIDLSEGAATALGIHSTGVASVAITALTNQDAVEVAEAPGDDQPPTVAAAPVRHWHRRHRAHH
jgi:rare lipoprotein A